jgi:ABC-type Zn uptake system ZnuABC Zn-binding protein ZnuA
VCGVPVKTLGVILLSAMLASCSAPRQGRGPSIPQDDKGVINVVTTFSTLNSFVEGVGGARVRVQNLVPVGASPEDYQPAPQDIATLSQARLVVQNGLGIESWLQRTIQNAGNRNVHILVLSNGMPHVIDHNPHLWMDPVLARAYVDQVLDALSQIDPAHRSEYLRNAANYNKKLVELQASIEKQISTIPPSQRAMIIFHNAFDYYNRRFGIRTVGVIELSPGQDPNPSYVAHLVDLARKNRVRAVFAEPEYSPKLAQTLAKSAGIQTVTNLYDDSIGNDPRVGDYVSMLRYDTEVIAQALK